VLIAPPKASLNIFGGKVWQWTSRNTVLHITPINTTRSTTNNMVFSPPKSHDPKPWTKVCVDMLGPWMIPQDNKKKKKEKSKPLVDMQSLLVLTILDLDTKWWHWYQNHQLLLLEP
jgi:hypothetical protein